MQWLETDFLDYLKEWEQSIRGRTGFTKAQKKMMGLSSETKIGLKVTGKEHTLPYIWIIIIVSLTIGLIYTFTLSLMQ